MGASQEVGLDRLGRGIMRLPSFLERQLWPITSDLAIVQRGGWLADMLGPKFNIWACDPEVYYGWIVETCERGGGFINIGGGLQ